MINKLLFNFKKGTTDLVDHVFQTIIAFQGCASEIK